MKINRLIISISILVSISLAGCTPKTDADIKTEIQTNLKSLPDLSGVTIDVKGGIVTIDGQCDNKSTSAGCEKIVQEVKGVKTVINNLTLANVVADTIAAPVTTAAPIDAPATPPSPDNADDGLAKSVSDISKKFRGVQANVKDGVITLTGEIKKNDLQKLMKPLSALKPNRIENNLRVVRGLTNKKSKARAKVPVSKKHSTAKKKRHKR